MKTSFCKAEIVSQQAGFSKDSMLRSSIIRATINFSGKYEEVYLEKATVSGIMRVSGGLIF